MFVRTCLVASFPLLLAACQPSTEMSPADTAAVADSVREMTDSLVAAAERADLAGTFRSFSADTHAAHLNDGMRFTRDSLLEAYGAIFASLDSQQVDLKQVTVPVLGPDAAVWSGNAHFAAFFKDGAPLESDAAWTLVWTRRAGRWTLLHSHQSLPRPLGS